MTSQIGNWYLNMTYSQDLYLESISDRNEIGNPDNLNLEALTDRPQSLPAPVLDYYVFC